MTRAVLSRLLSTTANQIARLQAIVVKIIFFAVRMFSDRSQMASKCGKNISDTLGCTFLFLPDFDVVCDLLIGSLSTRVFETRTATGSDLFFLLTCLDTTTFTLPSIFSPLEMISIKIWETPLS